MATSLVWFRDDLRVRDHPALLAGMAESETVALYVLDECSEGIRPLGGAARWWLHHALEDLRAELEQLGVPLVLRRGAAVDVVGGVLEDLGADAVYWNRRYGGPERTVDTELKKRAKQAGVHAESFQASLLYEPWTVRTGAGEHYKVFTPFWKAATEGDVRPPLAAPGPQRRPSRTLPGTDDLEDWALLPRHPDWAGGLRETWTPGASAGEELLADFVAEAMTDYPQDRKLPHLRGTSRLSPYLRWGHVSPFQVWHAATSHRDAGNQEAVRTFTSELGWREFCWHQLYHHPDLATRNLREEFDAFPWQWPAESSAADEGTGASRTSRPDRDPLSPTARVRAWQQGRTGIPLVDAGQRELWDTGWMHNRVRMVTASFLVKNLSIHWQVGEQWFWDTLVDADAANNPANWQWVAGSGADAAPFFRIFNPLRQQERFDPETAYISRWVPDHGGPDYPEPIVDVAETRRTALAAFQGLRHGSH